MRHNADVRVLGGLPISVDFEIVGPDPSVGLFSPWVEDWTIVAIGTRRVKKADWLYDRIMAKKGEEERLIEALLSDTTHEDRY
jgi:hypothetical protein